MLFDQKAFDRFAAAIEQRLGDKVRSEEAFCRRLYSSLTNVEWHHLDRGSLSYSFREAGALIAQIAKRGDYLDWYCSEPEGRPDEEIVALLGAEGWRHQLV